MKMMVLMIPAVLVDNVMRIMTEVEVIMGMILTVFGRPIVDPASIIIVRVLGIAMTVREANENTTDVIMMMVIPFVPHGVIVPSIRVALLVVVPNIDVIMMREIGGTEIMSSVDIAVAVNHTIDKSTDIETTMMKPLRHTEVTAPTPQRLQIVTLVNVGATATTTRWMITQCHHHRQ